MKRILIWILAFILTVAIAYYQRRTGPTYPVKDKFTVNGNQVELTYLRSHSTNSDAVIKFIVRDTNVYGFIYQRVYPLKVGFIALRLRRIGDTLVGIITKLPPAGKMEYYIELYNSKGEVIYSRKDQPVIIRFKGDVPAYFLIPHIIFMFLTILFGLVTGIYALINDKGYRRMQWITVISLLIGGFILGPIVQKYAFGQLWTGIPYGWDLTDNKTLIMLIGWLIAIGFNWRKQRRWWTVAAALLQIIVYLIPHSLFGSTLNPQTGEVTQGLVLWFFNNMIKF